MKDQEIHAELSSIRNLMERSAKFISLSGLSGIMAGIYALIGAGVGYTIVYGPDGTLYSRAHFIKETSMIVKVFIVAFAVLVLSITTGVFLSIKKSRKTGQKFWSTGSKRLLINTAIPLVSGGLLVLILMIRGHFEIISSVTLIFYGLALVAGSHYTYTDVKGLGILEILLGLLAALFPGYGLIFWSVGFGLLHIIYGTVMHFRYDS